MPDHLCYNASVSEPRRYQKTSSGPARPQAGGGKPAAKPAPGRSAPAARSARPDPGAKKPASGPAQRGQAASPRKPAQPGKPGLFSRVKGLFSRKPAPPAGKGLPPKPPAEGLSLDRKLDILGVFLIFIGLPTLLSLLSTNRSASTGGWLNLLGQIFGWGVYLFPVTLIMLGLWLVLRSFSRIPSISIERLFGGALLYANFLVVLQFFAFPQSSAQSYTLAEAGKGGGFTGAFLYETLNGSLGLGGLWVAVAAAAVIGLALILDVAVADLFKWLPPLILRLQDWYDDWSTRQKETPARRPALTIQHAAGGPSKGAAPAAETESGAPAAAGAAAAAAASVVQGVPGSEPVWVLPQIEEILDPGEESDHDDEADRARAAIIEETLTSFGAPVNVIEINRGPTITQFGVEPDFIESRGGRMRVRVSKIVALADDLALALSARAIRVQAPVPGKGFVGIEVPNEGKNLVALRDVLESEAMKRLKTPLRFALGQDVAGNAVAADLSAMPHLLIAGATGSGKSVAVNAIITCYLLNNSPDDLRLIMVDPKRVELTGYNGIPHLLAPVVVDMDRVVAVLQWVLREMDARYHKLADVGTRNITEYNNKITARGQKKMPRLVVIIDELADLMMLAPEDTERTLTRLAQLARATGIHLILATQRPSVEVVTGLIKANIPARIAFAVASNTDSRVILDQPGAERLLGRGDMLFQAPDSPAALRLQGVWVSDTEIQRLVQYWQMQASGAGQAAAPVSGEPVDGLPAGVPLKQMPLWEEVEEEEKDTLYDEAVDLARRQARASISMLQRRLRIGYTRAARLIERMQEKGIIGTEASAQGFEILDYGPTAPPADADN